MEDEEEEESASSAPISSCSRRRHVYPCWMRIGVLIGGELSPGQWAHGLGFRSVEWMRFDAALGIKNPKWQPFAEQFAAQAKSLDIRISAIGAYYRITLDPRQTEFARHGGTAPSKLPHTSA